MRKKSKMKDKRIIYIYIAVILLICFGVSYALTQTLYGFNTTTAYINIDESAYGSNTFDTTNLDFKPIQDNEVESTKNTNNIIKIDFKVGGASTNNTDKDIIYDIALNDMDVNCELLTSDIKWKLVKNGTEISSGSLDYKFDTMEDGRLVLTNTQQDLSAYNANKVGYDSYNFYMWMSDSCQGTIEECINNGDLEDQSNLLGKKLKGKIEVELYTGSKRNLQRNPSTSVDNSICSQGNVVTLDVNGGTSWTSSTCTSPFELNGEDCNKTIKYGETYGSLLTPTRTGYTFDGWYTKKSGGDKVTSTTNVTNTDSHNLYARWIPITYTVTYDYATNGGTSATLTSQELQPNTNINLSPTATKAGYEFIGWNTNKDAVEKLDYLYIGTSDVTLYAIYKKTNTATFYYYDGSNKASKTATCDMYNNSTSCDYTLPSGITDNRVVNSVTYTYRGITGSNTDSVPAGNETVGQKATSAYQYWYVSYTYNVTLTYNINGGSGTTPSNQTGTAYMNCKGTKLGATITLAPSSGFTKSAYTFVSWNTASDASGTNYTAGSSYSVFTADRTLYAKWRINVTQVQYHMNGGSWSTSTDSRLSYSGNYVTYNGSTIVSKYNYNKTDIDLADWDNPSWINILRANYMAKTGAEWCIMSGTTLTSTCFDDHATNIAATSLCDSTDGDCTVTLGVNWVAANYKINSSPNYYKATLQEAVSVASAGNTITVLQNNTDASTPVVNKNLTLNTNSKTVTRTSNIRVDSGTLTINGSGTLTRGSACTSQMIYMNSSSTGSLSATSVSITDSNTTTTSSFIRNDGSGTLTLGSGAKITTKKATAVYTVGTGKIVVNGATISNTDASANELIVADKASNGTVTISSGTITSVSTTNYALGINNNNGTDLTISGGTMTAPYKTVRFGVNSGAAAGTGAKFTMSGGTIKATSTSAAETNYALSLQGDASNGDPRYVISGGTIWHSGSGGGVWIGYNSDSTGAENFSKVWITGDTSQVYIYANGGNAALTVNGADAMVTTKKARIEGNNAWGLYVNSGGYAYVNNASSYSGLASADGTFISSVSNSAIYVTGNTGNLFKFGATSYRTSGYAPTAATGAASKYAINCGANAGTCNYIGGRLFTKTSTSYLINSNVSKYSAKYATKSSSGTFGTKYTLSYSYQGYYTANS